MVTVGSERNKKGEAVPARHTDLRMKTLKTAQYLTLGEAVFGRPQKAGVPLYVWRQNLELKSMRTLPVGLSFFGTQFLPS